MATRVKVATTLQKKRDPGLEPLAAGRLMRARLYACVPMEGYDKPEAVGETIRDPHVTVRRLLGQGPARAQGDPKLALH